MRIPNKGQTKPLRLFLNRFHNSQKGISLIETVIAVAILGLVSVTFLSGMATGTKATSIASEQAVAECLIRSEAEYVKRCGYQYYASEYPVDPTLTIPEGWTVPAPSVVPVHATDDGMQEVTISAQRHGETVLSIIIYKVAR